MGDILSEEQNFSKWFYALVFVLEPPASSNFKKSAFVIFNSIQELYKNWN